ncbi:ArsR/SmtB family transcription factor [Vallitalea okinawensis]|uniref:ArsR/SmtB family transcription factor n=1 Tax=Vallitalea okinawensis TaxID=2078660 RepID=UPI000CFBB82F|nr:metalloregulator ArsR/SmtB family transcription factor [Vallitalea okinawensis]
MEEKQIRILKALAHPIRLQIVKILIDHGELCVCQLNENVEFSQSNLSQHLKILRDASVVNTRKKGQWMMYRVEDESINKIMEALEHIQ